MLRRFWLLFAQVATVCVAALFVVATLRPDLLAGDPLLRRFFPGLSEGEPRRATSLGSGVIVSSEGYVLTNNHVIEGADDIQLVLADGRRLRATVRGSDPESVLAGLKAEGKDLPAITLGKLDNVQVGDTVLALGNPFGFGNT